MDTVRISTLNLDTGGRSQSFSISSAASVMSAKIDGDAFIFQPTVDCFMRSGTLNNDVTAVADGTDIFFFGGNTYRIDGHQDGNKVAIIAVADPGMAYITPQT